MFGLVTVVDDVGIAEHILVGDIGVNLNGERLQELGSSIFTASVSVILVKATQK